MQRAHSLKTMQQVQNATSTMRSLKRNNFVVTLTVTSETQCQVLHEKGCS